MTASTAIVLQDVLVATASGVSAIKTNYSHSFMTFFFDVTAVSGTLPTLTFKLQMRDIASGKWVDVPGAITGVINSVSTVLLTIGAGLVAAANAVVVQPVPHDWRIAWTIGGTTPSFTFTVGLNLGQ